MKVIQFDEACTVLTDGPANGGEQTERTSRDRRQSRIKPLFGSLLLAAIVLAASASQAALVTYEGFPYSPGIPDSINTRTGGTGWDFGWGVNLAGAVNYGITNGSLSSGSLFTSSNRVFSTGGFAGRFFTFTDPVTSASYGDPGTTNYFSILIRPETTPTTDQYYGLELLGNSGQPNMLIGKNGSSLFYGLEYATNNIAGNSNVFFRALSSTQATANQTVLLVVRVVFTGGADAFSLYINPTPGGSEPVTPDVTLNSLDIGQRNALALLCGGTGALVSYDEVRVGSTYASVNSTVASPAGLWARESFEYNSATVTNDLQGQPRDGSQGTNGWDNVTWNQFLSDGGTNFWFLSGSLSDPSSLLATSGNSVHNSQQVTNQFFAGRFNSYTGSGSYTNPTYFSVLIRPDNLGNTNGAAFFQIFGQPSGNDLYAGYLFGSSTWGLQNLSTQVLSSVSVVSNQTVLLVIRGNYIPSGLNTFRLYVNPTPGAPEPVTADATYTFTTASLPVQNGVALQIQNKASATFDEIRVGTTFADVTPVVLTVPDFRITSIARTGNDIALTWNTTGGTTNRVQITNGSNGNFATNGFTDVGSLMIIPGSGSATTNYVDLLGVTNQPSRYYRVRQVP